MRIKDASFTVVDVETTGLSPYNHRITEIALLRVAGGKIVDRFETLLNPEQYIPPFIAQYTGITNAMVYGKPRFTDTTTEISNFVRSNGEPYVVVGHNVSFDAGFIRSSFDRAETPLFHLDDPALANFLCTCKLARVLLPKLTKRSLKHVSDYFGIKMRSQHRAMVDAEATAKVLIEFLGIAEEMGAEEIPDLLALQTKRSTGAKPRRTKAVRSVQETVRTFPERPGVYIMHDATGGILYVGKAKNLRDRVSSYFTRSAAQSSRKLKNMMKTVREIVYEETGSELSALLLESRKIKELHPRFNTLERRYKSYAFLRLDVQKEYPKLESVKEPASDGSEYYGPFRSWRSVEALIEVINRNFTLRECGDEFRVAANVKPCFYYEIARCKAPCAMLESKSDYRKEVDRLRAFLSSGEEGIIALVERMMMDAAERLDFEEAQFLKERLFEMRRVLGAGERPLSSLNTNDYVIMTRAGEQAIEIFFVRYGRLAKQITLTDDHLPKAEEWFYRQLRMYYSASASAIPPTCGKPEIDEMRILAAWADRKRRDGMSRIVYLTSDWEQVVPRLTRELTSVIKNKRVTKKSKAESTTDVPIAIISPEAFSTAKRLTLKPMVQRR